jgi:hypothetical protein
MKKVIPYLAEHPDQWVKGQVLAELVYTSRAAGCSGGALGSFTKTASKRYGRSNWLFKAFHDKKERT